MSKLVGIISTLSIGMLSCLSSANNSEFCGSGRVINLCPGKSCAIRIFLDFKVIQTRGEVWLIAANATIGSLFR